MMIIVVFLLTIVKLSVQQSFFLPPTKTSPVQFPYHAYVSSDYYCLGALISSRFVVVNGICIESRKKAKVYLGTFESPFYTFGKGQKVLSTELILHPRFAHTYDSGYIYNIGLIKLLEEARISTTVKPIALPNPALFPLPAGVFINITGYFDSMLHSNTLRYMTARVRNQEECLSLYGATISRDYEQCYTVAANERLDWVGPVASNGVLVGLSRSYYDQPQWSFVEWINKQVQGTTLPHLPQLARTIEQPENNWEQEMEIVEVGPVRKGAER